MDQPVTTDKPRDKLREAATALIAARGEPDWNALQRVSDAVDAALGGAEGILALLDALSAAERRAETAERDAARYRWLREQSHPWGAGNWCSLAVLDAAIDRALSPKGAA